MADKMDEDTRIVIEALKKYKSIEGNTLTGLARRAAISQSILTQAHRERVDSLSPAVMKKLVPVLLPGHEYGIYRAR